MASYLPILKERRMIGEDSSGMESAQIISNSYAGILRLSPNSSGTLKNVNSSITNTSEIKDYINYDDVVGEYLKRQYITVSASDGSMVDMAISDIGVEYNTLYVRGAVAVTPVYSVNTPYSAVTISINNTDNLGGLYINGYKMPAVYNDKILDVDKDESMFENTFNPYDSSSLDKAYILLNASDEETRYEFFRASEIIDTFVKEALLKLKSLPTGSIHFIPLTVKEYVELANADNWLHNNKDSTNPLIRDFLICDGQTYNNSDYPELAKILYKETITSNGVETTNTYENSKTFKVPDLRNMFIQSAVPLFSPDDEYDSKTKVGTVTDASFPIGIDNHYHFTVLDSSIAMNNNTNNIVKENTLKETSSSAPLARYGSFKKANNRSGSGCPGCHQKTCFGASGSPSYILPPEYSPKGCKNGSPTCGYVLTNPSDTNITATTGKTSTPQWTDSGKWTNTTNFDDSSLNYTKNNIFFYKKPDNSAKPDTYATYKGKALASKLGRDTNPEFFGVIPLIKI
jgi:hypothetical protein